MTENLHGIVFLGDSGLNKIDGELGLADELDNINVFIVLRVVRKGIGSSGLGVRAVEKAGDISGNSFVGGHDR